MSHAADENYDTHDTCDGCGEHRLGTMLHAEGATGRVAPVLFLCYPCQGKPEPEEAEEAEGEEYDEEPWDGFLTDAEADADVLAGAGWGCDEDYGCFGGDE